MKRLILSVSGVILLTLLIFFIAFSSLGGWYIEETNKKILSVALAGFLAGFLVFFINLIVLEAADLFGFNNKIKTIASSTLLPAFPVLVTAIIVGFALTPISKSPFFFLDVLIVIIAIVVAVYLTSPELIKVSKKWLVLFYFAESLIIFGIIFGFGKFIT